MPSPLTWDCHGIEWRPSSSSLATYSTTTCAYSATTTPPTYHDWLIMEQMQLFFLAFIGIGILFTYFRRRL